MKRVIVTAAMFLVTILGFDVNAQVNPEVAKQVDDLLWEEAKLRDRIESNLAPIKSMRELKAHLASIENSGSPIRHLSPDGRLRFLRSLTLRPARTSLLRLHGPGC